jgi:hypothetical protein
MGNASEQVVARIRKLGFACDEVSTDVLQSATAALSCVPMYMVSNVHGWTEDKQFKIPFLNVEGSESFREAFVIGQEEAALDIDKPHRKVLTGFLRADHAADLIIYEYALDTLRMFLAEAGPSVASQVRVAVARMIVNVAKASGKGIGGSGEKVSAEERECITQITDTLGLRAAPEAKTTLAELDASDED